MARAGACCASLEEPKTLMKMGLSTILIGHVNFLLGALVHGVVLRHINLHKQARALEYAISNVVALTAGLMGVVVGILAIVLSKNKKSKSLTWSLFAVSLLSALMAAASCIGLFVSVVRAIIHDGRSLLTHCRFPDAIGYSSVTNECPFDPTRIYSTTLILWVPLIVTCFIQLVFSARCFAACVSFLGLPCCPPRKRPAHYTRAINVVRPVQETSHHAEPPGKRKESLNIYTKSPRRYKEPVKMYTESLRRHKEPTQIYTKPPSRHGEPTQIYTEPPRRHGEPTQIYTEPPRRHGEPPRRATVPRIQHQPPPPPSHPSRQHRSHPERQPLRQPNRERPGRERSEMRAGRQQRTSEHHQLLQRGTHERSSFWI